MTRKVGQTGLVLVCDKHSLVGLYKQDYKSLCAAVMIYLSGPKIAFLYFDACDLKKYIKPRVNLSVVASMVDATAAQIW